MHIAHEILGALAGDDDLAAGVGGDVDLQVVGLEGETCSHLKGRPVPAPRTAARSFCIWASSSLMV
jgi:hypothetical protein